MNKIDQIFFEILENAFKEYDIVFQYKDELEHISKIHDDIITYIFDKKTTNNKPTTQQQQTTYTHSPYSIYQYIEQTLFNNTISIADFKNAINDFVIVMIFNCVVDDIITYYIKNKNFNNFTLQSCISLNNFLHNIQNPIIIDINNTQAVKNAINLLLTDYDKFLDIFNINNSVIALTKLLFMPNVATNTRIYGNTAHTTILLANRQVNKALNNIKRRTKNAIVAQQELQEFFIEYYNALTQALSQYNNIQNTLLSLFEYLSVFNNFKRIANLITSYIATHTISTNINKNNILQIINDGFAALGNILHINKTIINTIKSQLLQLPQNYNNYWQAAINPKTQLQKIWKELLPNEIKEAIINALYNSIHTHAHTLDKYVNDIFKDLRGTPVFEELVHFLNNFTPYTPYEISEISEQNIYNNLNDNDTNDTIHDDLKTIHNKYTTYINMLFNNKYLEATTDQDQNDQQPQKQETQTHTTPNTNTNNQQNNQKYSKDSDSQYKSLSVKRSIINPKEELNARIAIQTFIAIVVLFGFAHIILALQKYLQTQQYSTQPVFSSSYGIGAKFDSNDTINTGGIFSSLINYIKNLGISIIHLYATKLPYQFSTITTQHIETILNTILAVSDNPLLTTLEKINAFNFNNINMQYFLRKTILKKINFQQPIEDGKKRFENDLKQLSTQDITNIIKAIYTPQTHYSKQKTKVEQLKQNIKNIKQFGRTT